MTTLALWLSTILSAADTACAESGRDYADGAAVLQVVRNRARSGWARYDGSLIGALWSPWQHAHGCRWPMTARHLELGVRFLFDRLKAPPWARRALWYVGDHDPPDLGERRGGVLVGVVRHRFYAAPGVGLARR